MIKKFIDRLLGKSADAGPAHPLGKRENVPASVHGIDPTLVDGRALDVVRTLKQAGYEAYIVGGAVRDLLLGLRPKDFDVATDATPEEVKSLFRRAFIIGRRFRIVHVVYGRGRDNEVIEVSTFRAQMDSASAEQVAGNERSHKAQLAGMKHAVDASGRVLRDNVWGPIEQDAARRDFTINAMYYDPETETVVDFHHGIRDAKKRLLRMIGDPAARYREDPVRIIRAVRFAAKLNGVGFKIDSKTRSTIAAALPLLADVPQSRLFDEMLKLLQTGHALASIEQLRANGLATGIYPLLDLVVQRAEDPFVRSALQDTDRRVGEGKPVAPSFLLACVLWSDVRDGWNQRLAQRMPPFPALQEAVDVVFDARIGDVSGRGKLGADMREIWVMQPRFERRTGQTPFTLAEQPRFRAGFDFLRLRAQVGEVPEELAHWWETFSTATDAICRDMVETVRLEQQRARQRSAGSSGSSEPRTRAEPRRDTPRDTPREAPRDTPRDTPREAPRHADADTESAHCADAAEDSLSEPPPAKKRRRRRRKPGEGAAPAREDGPDGDAT